MLSYQALTAIFGKTGPLRILHRPDSWSSARARLTAQPERRVGVVCGLLLSLLMSDETSPRGAPGNKRIDIHDPDEVRHGSRGSPSTDVPRQEPQKSYHTILEQHVRQAQEELERPAVALLLSGLSAGLDLGFGPFLMAVMTTLTAGELPHSVSQILIALAYSAGFIFVVMGRSELFTEQTTSAVLPVLSRRANLRQLLRLWALVLVANLVGATVIAAIIAQVGPRMGAIEISALGEIAARLLSHPWWIMLLSAIAAGWLMGLLAWLVIASRDTVSQIIVVMLTTFVIGIAGFHHSIAGTTEVLMGVFASAGPTVADFAPFLLWSVLGNAVGGAVFVAVLKFGHVHAS